MAVIWKEENEKRYVTPGGWPPSSEDIELAKKYEISLKLEFAQIRKRLTQQGFLKMKPGLKKWYLLGQELQFLDYHDLRKKCDPDLETTWRHLYDIAADLSPTQKIPTDKARSEGRRNHFHISYRLAKIPWNVLKQLNWRAWGDIFMAFTPDMWRDNQRILKWLIEKSQIKLDQIDAIKLRKALLVLRHLAGTSVAQKKSTRFMEEEELFKLLDDEFYRLQDMKYNLKPVNKKPLRKHKKGSKYDPILDAFLEGSDNLVKIQIENKDANYLRTQIIKRIENRNIKKIKVSVINNIVYLEKIARESPSN